MDSKFLDKTSFEAKFIKNLNIKKNFNGTYKPSRVKLVELKKQNFDDMQTLKDLEPLWYKYGYNSATYISSILRNLKYYKDSPIFVEKLYALTTQSTNLENLKKEKILGVVDFQYRKDVNRIDYLQTNPLYIRKYRKCKDYKGIGTAIVEYLKEISDKSIELTSSKIAEPFYIKLGFKKNSICEPEYIWEK